MKIPWFRGRKALILLLCLSPAVACSPPPSPVTTAEVAALQPDAFLIGAGDIALCIPGKKSPAQATAALIEQQLKLHPSAVVFTTGDNVYQNGTPAEFQDCYDNAWGSFKMRTRPSPGNHDYGIYLSPARNSADPYFDYFGANAFGANADAKGDGYYSYDLGGWHIVSLNSMAGRTGAPSMEKQVQWLKGDLAQSKKACILAYWHHPLYSSGHHGSEDYDPGRDVRPLWEVLYEHGADIILTGHDHHYERFKPLNPMGETNDPKGILQFIVGTGGREVEPIQTELTTSDKILDGPADFGILALTLRPSSYEWQFLKIDGSVGDASSGPQDCH